MLFLFHFWPFLFHFLQYFGIETTLMLLTGAINRGERANASSIPKNREKMRFSLECENIVPHISREMRALSLLTNVGVYFHLSGDG